MTMAEPLRKDQTPEQAERPSPSPHLMPHVRRRYALRLGWALEGLSPLRRAEILERLDPEALWLLLEETGVTDDR